jgi:hypothetical protein
MNYGCSPLIGLSATVGHKMPAIQPSQPILGDVVYLHLFGQGLIFLSSPTAVFELMEKRNVIYSDRAPLVMVTELFVLYIAHHSANRDYFLLAAVLGTWCAV